MKKSIDQIQHFNLFELLINQKVKLLKSHYKNQKTPFPSNSKRIHSQLIV